MSNAFERLVAELEIENAGLLSLLERRETRLENIDQRLKELEATCAALLKAVSKLSDRA